MPCFYTYEQGWETAPAQRIFLAVPSYDGKIEPMALISILKGMELLRGNGIGCTFSLLDGDCHVDDARNGMVHAFLESDCTDMVFIDADVAFRPENLLRLVQHDAELVAGVYPKKQDPAEFPVLPLGGERWARPDGLVEVAGAPTGFMRIARATIEKLVEAHKDRHFYPQGPTDGRPHPILFERTLEESRRWSGDYSFCRKWRAIGGKVLIDPEMDFGHVGSFAWTGRLSDYWRREAGEEPVRFVLAMGRLKAGDPKPEDFVTLHEAWGNPWAASPEFLIAAYSMAKKVKGPVLETGSGLSTLVMAAAGADVTSLEHDLAWYRRVRAATERLGLGRVGNAQIGCRGANLLYVPLEEDGWYEWDTESDDLALIICDGPPRNLADRSFVFGQPWAQGADWLIDDATEAPGRPYERIEASKPFVIAKRPN